MIFNGNIFLANLIQFKFEEGKEDKSKINQFIMEDDEDEEGLPKE